MLSSLYDTVKHLFAILNQMKKIFLISLVLTTTLFLRPKTIFAENVMLLIFNPVIESQNNQKLSQFLNWSDPDQLTQQYILDVKDSSGGIVNYQITKKLEVDGFPVKADGFKYSDETYLECWRDHSKCHSSDSVDYYKILSDYDVCGKRNRDEIHELWIFGGPWFGYWEAVMAGLGAFWTNAPPLYNSTCQKQLHIMGFSYERGVSEMLENLGHRVEGTMSHLYNGWAFGYGPPSTQLPTSLTNWDKFSAKEYDPGVIAGCGFIHGSLNTPNYNPSNYWSYDWGNTNFVQSTCNDWLNFPNLTSQTETINCQAWNCTGYGFKKWWFNHIPRYEGKTDGKWNNWWRYILDYEEATKVVNILDLRSLLQSFTNIFDYNKLVADYGK